MTNYEYNKNYTSKFINHKLALREFFKKKYDRYFKHYEYSYDILTNKKEENWYYEDKSYLSDLKNINDVEKYFIDNILKDITVRNINV